MQVFTESLDTIAEGDVNKHFTSADEAKLDSIEAGATADQTDTEIKTAYENNADTNAFTDAEKSKLSGIATGAEVNTVDSVNAQIGDIVLDADDISDAITTNKFTTQTDINKLAGIEAGATTDQTGAEIKALYESESNTNAYTDAEKSKLLGVQAGAQVNAVDSVNAQIGVVVLDADDISDTTTTNKFTTQVEIDKLSGIEAGATADQTGAEIKAAYEGELNTNAFTDAEQTKLAGVESNANNYSLPVAGVSLGGVLSGTDISIDASGNVSIVDDSHNHIINNVDGLQTALDAKEPTIAVGTTAQYYRGDKTFQTLDKSAVGLGNVDNTSDLNKPISTATQAALDIKADISTLTDYSWVRDAGTYLSDELNGDRYVGYTKVSETNIIIKRIISSAVTYLQTAASNWVNRTSLTGWTDLAGLGL